MSALARDDDRHTGRVHHCCADRAEQQSGEAAAAVAADHDQLGRLGLLEQVMRGPVENDDATNADIGVALLPASQAFGEGFMRPRFGHAPFQRMNTG